MIKHYLLRHELVVVQAILHTITIMVELKDSSMPHDLMVTDAILHTFMVKKPTTANASVIVILRSIAILGYTKYKAIKSFW